MQIRQELQPGASQSLKPVVFVWPQIILTVNNADVDFQTVLVFDRLLQPIVDSQIGGLSR